MRPAITSSSLLDLERFSIGPTQVKKLPWYTMWYYHTQKTMVENGNFSWYTMVWYDMVYHVVCLYHGIPHGITIPKKPWQSMVIFHGIPWYDHVVIP